MTGFDPAELARLAKVSEQWDRRIAASHTPLGNEALIEIVQDDHRTLTYFTTHRAAIVAALTRAQETEKVIERVRARHVKGDGWCGPVCGTCRDKDGWNETWPCSTIAALGGATTTTGDEA